MPEKKETGSFDMESLQRVIKKLADEVIDIKKNNNEHNQSRGYFRPPFKKNYQDKPSVPPPESLNVEEVANVLRALMTSAGNQNDQNTEDCPEEIPEEETDEDSPDDPLGDSINHYSYIFDEAEEAEEVNMSQHPYNTRNHPVQNNDISSTSNQDKNNNIPKNSNINEESIPKLEYDVIDDLKKLKANISVYELLKIPAIQNQALQTLTGGKTPKGKVISTL